MTTKHTSIPPKSLLITNQALTIPSKAPTLLPKHVGVPIDCLDLRRAHCREIWDAIPDAHKYLKPGTQYAKSAKRISPEMAIAAGWWQPSFETHHDLLSFEYIDAVQAVAPALAWHRLKRFVFSTTMSAVFYTHVEYCRSVLYAPGMSMCISARTRREEEFAIRALKAWRPDLTVETILDSDIHAALERRDYTALRAGLHSAVEAMATAAGFNEEAA